VLAQAVEPGIDVTEVTGAFRAPAEEFRADQGNRLLTAADWPEAYSALRKRLKWYDIALLGMSRGVRMEGLLEPLEDDFVSPGAQAKEG
jgi:hypothetical protein